MLEKFKTKVLEKSGSYNHYKKENEILTKDLNKKINKLSKENKRLSKKIKENEKILNSYQDLFEIIYFNHETIPIGVWDKIQCLEQELLIFIKHVCEKNGLDCWLDYGTLIGAVRHHGFIPWDDDVDLGMMRKDFEKIYPLLVDEVKKYNLDEHIDVRLYHKNMYDKVIGFLQFTYRYPGNGITLSNVDIFPYDFIESEDLINDELYYSERLKFHSRLSDLENPKLVVSDYMSNLNLQYENASFIVPGGEAARGKNQQQFDIFHKDNIFPLISMKFKDIEFKCPNNYDRHLKGIYGDYTRLPKIIHHHNLVRVLKTIDDIIDQFDVAIEIMKDANSNFK